MPSSPVLSPYFSPVQRRKYKVSFGKNPSHEESEEDQNTRADQAIARAGDQAVFKDPLFGFYFRRFLDLYQLLYALKPKLVQESVAHDPWKLLVAVTLLNKTAGKAAIPVFWTLMNKWATPWAMSRADPEELKNHVHCLGTYNVRSHRLIEISKAYISDPPRENDVRPSRPASPIKRCLTDTPRRNERYTPTPISHLPGTGPYALDSYRIFCLSHSNPFCEEWKAVLPTDKELVLYLRWKWAYQQRKEWSPLTGRLINADIPFLEWLVDELTGHHIRSKP